MNKLAVLMTSHGNNVNCETALSALDEALQRAGINAVVFLANSSKTIFGTTNPYKSLYIDEFSTSNDTFWAKGMRLAWERCLRHHEIFEKILWLNDDTKINTDGFMRANSELLEVQDSIIVGACVGKDGAASYGGYTRKSMLLPLHLNKMKISDLKQPCDTFNGNFVLLGFELFKKLGGFPSGYSHLRADIHFGLVARKARIPAYVASGFVGECEFNLGYFKYGQGRGYGILERIRMLNDKKFGPLAEHISFSLKHGGILGPLYALSPIVRMILGR
jgi:GT2 family glycosyltransferase